MQSTNFITKLTKYCSPNVVMAVASVSVGGNRYGGYTENALKYVQKNGISKESEYGYMGRERILGCKKSKTPAAAITGFRTIDNPNEQSLEEAVSQQPVIIRLQCSGSFREYKGGIIDSPPAAPKSEGMFVHYVLIVGYDTDSAGVKFWRIKNTAGEGWGEGGFGKLRRHLADQRGVLGSPANVVLNAYMAKLCSTLDKCRLN
ncbi:Ervatamin-B [Hordeum vulgare]|nr:Ervatamin-B [Hordeum vulgare]